VGEPPTNIRPDLFWIELAQGSDLSDLRNKWRISAGAFVYPTGRRSVGSTAPKAVDPIGEETEWHLIRFRRGRS
jgi:hypothetical protein